MVSETVDHAVFVTDSGGTIEYVNPAFEEITGYTVAEAIGRTPALVATEEDDGWFDDVRERILAGEICDGEIDCRHKNGERYRARQHLTPTVDDGDIVRIVGILTATTGRADLESKLLRKGALSDHMERLANVGGWEYDIATGSFYWTEGTHEMAGLSQPADLDLADVLDFFHPEDRAVVQGILDDCLKSAEQFSATVRAETDDGHRRWVEMTCQSAERDGRTVIQGAVKDVTDQKRKSQRLMVLNRVLRHNIRNDLTAVTGYAELLEDELRDLENSLEVRDELSRSFEDRFLEFAERTESLETDLERAIQLLDKVTSFEVDSACQNASYIREVAAEIIEVAEKVRDIERYYEQPDSLTAVDVWPLLESLQTSYQNQYPEVDIDLTGPSVTIRGDEEALGRALDELLENACKHADGDVTVHTEVDDSEVVMIRVTDNGPGIPESEKRAIENGEETALAHASGIGLWLVKWLIDQQDGEIRIEDSEPRGSAVELFLPHVDGDR